MGPASLWSWDGDAGHVRYSLPEIHSALTILMSPGSRMRFMVLLLSVP